MNDLVTMGGTNADVMMLPLCFSAGGELAPSSHLPALPPSSSVRLDSWRHNDLPPAFPAALSGGGGEGEGAGITLCRGDTAPAPVPTG